MFRNKLETVKTTITADFRNNPYSRPFLKLVNPESTQCSRLCKLSLKGHPPLSGLKLVGSRITHAAPRALLSLPLPMVSCSSANTPNAICTIISKQSPMRSTHQRIPPPSYLSHLAQSTPIIKGTHPARRLKAQICCWTNRSGVFIIMALIHWLTAFEYVDQAVNILSEIWCPQDVPSFFKAPSKGSPRLLGMICSFSSTNHCLRWLYPPISSDLEPR